MEPSREKYIVPGHALVPRYDITVGKPPHVPHMKIPGDARVRKMNEEFLVVFFLGDMEVRCEPTMLPLLLNGDVIVRVFIHGSGPFGNEDCFI
jgi:hypothetical protein